MPEGLNNADSISFYLAPVWFGNEIGINYLLYNFEILELLEHKAMVIQLIGFFHNVVYYTW